LAYLQTTLASVLSQLGTLLDDPDERYWTATEKTYAVWEALRVWGAYTNYWRSRGTFDIGPSAVWYDLSVQLPTLRPRLWTLQQITQEIQYACLEAANGINGAGMSQQITVLNILQSVKRARNQFVLDAMFPLTATPLVSPSPGDATVQFEQDAVALHRVSWQDAQTGIWHNLWREDGWSIDANDPKWTVQQGMPAAYSESERAPLTLQLYPVPANTGATEALLVPSLDLDLGNGDASLQVPDEWVHAIKWAALADLFGSESQNADPLRAKYAMERYKQAISMAKDARNIMRAQLQGLPLQIDAMAAIDAGMPYWRTQTRMPFVAGALYDLFCPAPAANRTYGVSVDVVQAAPLPQTGAEYLQIGYEDLDDITNYASHILTFKCGGQEFQNTFAQYDAFMQAVAGRNAANKGKIRYMKDLFGMPQKEEQMRPDKMQAA
jgi:hypothetical protein